MNDDDEVRGVGPFLDQLGVVCDWKDSEMPMDAVVILRIYSPEDGDYRLAVCYSPKTDFIVRRGMMELAHDFESMGSSFVTDVDDDE